MTRAEAARYLGISVAKLRSYHRRGVAPRHHLASGGRYDRHYEYQREDLDAWTPPTPYNAGQRARILQPVLDSAGRPVRVVLPPETVLDWDGYGWRLVRLGAEDFLRVRRRPKTRGECEHGPRPCPWVGCRYHLYLSDQTVRGSLRACADVDPLQLEHTCALDLADERPHRLDEIGRVLNVSRERVRQIVQNAIAKLKRGMEEYR